jgi:putative transposase
MTKDIVLNALLMAVWRRNPEKQVLVHSDQGVSTQAMSGSRS